MAPCQPSVTPHQRSPSRCRDPKPPKCASLPSNLDPDRLVQAVKMADLPRPPIQRESLVDKVADFLSRFRSVMKANLQQEAAWPIHATRAYAKHSYSQGSVNFSSLNWGETKNAIACLSLSREPGPLAANYLDTIQQRTFEKSPSLLLRLQTVEEALSQDKGWAAQPLFDRGQPQAPIAYIGVTNVGQVLPRNLHGLQGRPFS